MAILVARCFTGVKCRYVNSFGNASDIATSRRGLVRCKPEKDLYQLEVRGQLADGNRGRGSQNRAKILAPVSFGRNEDDPKYCKLHVVKRLDSATVEHELRGESL